MAKQDREKSKPNSKQKSDAKTERASRASKRAASSGRKKRRTSAAHSLESLPLHPDDDATLCHVVIETSKGSPNKLGYDGELGAFTLHAVLPQGAVFPFDSGFLPQTKGGDGDPLDVLVLTQAPVAPGTEVPTRLVGVIEAEQREKSEETVRNDRIIGVAPACALYRDVGALDDLPTEAVDEIEQFFVNYERQEGKEFRPLGRGGPREAAALVKGGMRGRRWQALNPSGFGVILPRLSPTRLDERVADGM